MASTKTATYAVQGMHCASCANVIKRTLNRVDGVEKVESFYGTEEAVVTFNEAKANVTDFNSVLEPLGYALKSETTNESVAATEHHTSHHEHGAIPSDAQLSSDSQEAAFSLPLALFVFGAMLWELVAKQFSFVPSLPFPESLWLQIQFLLASLVLLSTGQVFAQAVWLFIRYRKANMDTLVGLGTLTAFVYSVLGLFFPGIFLRFGLPVTMYFDVVIVVIGFVKYGKHIEAQSKKRTGEALQALMKLQPQTAELKKGKSFVQVPLSEVAVGDILRVKPGESVPVDGSVIEGESLVNESMITGESLPVLKTAGDQVIGSTINDNGVLVMRAEKIGQETVLAKIVQLVKNAQNSKAPIERLADKVSEVFVPVVLLIAILTFMAWLVIGVQFLPLTQAITLGISCLMGVLVIACPCALGLATPTAIIVGVGQAAKKGILIKNAESLEQLQSVTSIVFDKTGTLTTGHPTVTGVKKLADVSVQRVLEIAMALESVSTHPLAKAIVEYAKKLEIKPAGKVEAVKNISGEGVHGTIKGKKYQLISLQRAQKLDKNLSALFQAGAGESVVVLVEDSQVLGVITLADPVKETSSAAVADLKKLGINVIMLSGDRQETAEYIAQQVGIERVHGEVTPQKKLDFIKQLQARGEKVAMVGDGINDAPALAVANVGIALSTGTDVAMSTAQATILKGDLQKVVIALKLSKAVMSTIRQNLFWAFGYNVIGIPVAAGVMYPLTGLLLSPAFAGLAMAFSSVSVVLNSLRLKMINLNQE